MHIITTNGALLERQVRTVGNRLRPTSTVSEAVASSEASALATLAGGCNLVCEWPENLLYQEPMQTAGSIIKKLGVPGAYSMNHFK